MGQIGKFSIRKGQQKAGRNEGFEENFRKIFDPKGSAKAGRNEGFEENFRKIFDPKGLAESKPE